jgi:hypothetical protein
MDLSVERAEKMYLYISQRSAPNATASHAAVIAAKLAVQDFEEGSAEPDAVEQQLGTRGHLGRTIPSQSGVQLLA